MLNSKNYKKILVFGSIAKDEILFFPNQFSDFLDSNHPENFNFSFLVDKIDQQLGGIATNISYSLAQLTSLPVHILGGVGKVDGDIFLDFFERNSIKTDCLMLDEQDLTGTYKALTDQKQNQIGGFYYGANKAGNKINLATIEDIKNSFFVLSPSHPEAFYKIQTEAIDLELDYFYDPGMALSWIEDKTLKQGVIHSKFVAVNESEFKQLKKKLQMDLDEILAYNVNLIITKGKHGVDFYSKNEVISVPSFATKKVGDPTAAGDSFRAGFIASLLNGDSTKEALKKSSVCASICIEHKGGVDHIFSEEEVKTRLKTLLE